MIIVSIVAIIHATATAVDNNYGIIVSAIKLESVLR